MTTKTLLEIRRLHSQGLSDTEIAKRLGHHVAWATIWRQRLGLERNTRPGGRPRKLYRLAKGRTIHMERFTGIDRPAFLPGGKTPQEDIDTCVDRCPWPSKPMMCSRCKGHPELVKDIYKGRMEHLTVKEHTIRAMIMWLEWRARQPDNPDSERTREILRGIRHDKAV